MKRLPAYCFACLAVAPAGACDGLTATAGWLRQPVPGTNNAAAYVTLANRGATTIHVTGVSSADFAGAMLHETRYADGGAHMHHVAVLELESGETYRAAPGGAHIMLGQPRHAISAGMTVRLRFVCAEGAPLDVEMPVLKRAPE